MMQPFEVAASYDTIAGEWLGDHLEHNGIRQHRQALRFRSGGGRALDVGSGCNGRFIRLLAEHGYKTEGLDISGEMIALARERSPDTIFHHADICEWLPEKPYDFITAWDSIWHVPQDRAEEVMEKLFDALSPGGVFIWTTGGLDGPAEKRDAAMGPPMYYSVPGIPRTLELIAQAGCVCRHLEYDQHPEQHLFLIAQKL